MLMLMNTASVHKNNNIKQGNKWVGENKECVYMVIFDLLPAEVIM